ncbi:nucleotide-binding domain-containing protein [Meira miltonrushii]|uniref:Nucleotide-binding domain-containing protein n=1 Tax=Meira miltonrushii TaxID=1280837 RepID=A0A316VMD8_9BASI|nr:nucleotide-binding domain-containing protein [Meira miltonrushii]PWN37261.1 nucleotide-binding domain-containing protein [Meira miltonrushii]
MMRIGLSRGIPHSLPLARLPVQQQRSVARLALSRSKLTGQRASIRYTSTAAPPPTPPPTAPPLPPPRRPGFFARHPAIKWTLFGAGSIVFGLSSTVLIILSYDAFTYKEAHVDKVPLTPLAMHPTPGGPNNLPILSHFVDETVDVLPESKKKERLVIVGGGWASVALLMNLNPDEYDVVLVSPNNFFLFTPLLPSATVGTVEPRTLVEPLRKILARVKGHYIQGRAVDAVMGSALPSTQGGEDRLLEVEVIDGHTPDEASSIDGASNHLGKHVYIPYDRLVVAVGAVTNDHGVPGLENCFHLKTVQDARKIRSHILDNLEIASLPTTTPEERDRLLSFVVCGGGPTGVETAAEIHDMLDEDILKLFPKQLRASSEVHLIQSRSHILNTYSEAISEYAEKKFSRDDVNVITNARVKRVEPDKVIYTIKDEDGNLTEKEVPSGFTLWSTGIAMSPFTRKLTHLLPNQSHLKALQVDSHLRVRGAPLGSMYAMGDSSTVDTHLIDYIYDFVDQCDTDHDSKLNFNEFQVFAQSIKRKFPLASKHFNKLQETFEKYDKDRDGHLDLNEIAEMLLETQNKMTALPATAQVASQQGNYLGKKLNKLAKVRNEGRDMNPHDESDVFDLDDQVYDPFQYRNLGSLAYIGNAAAFDIPLPGPLQPIGSFAGGLVAMYAWRSFYLSEAVSTRMKILLLSDYIRRGLFGRDVSRI